MKWLWLGATLLVVSALGLSFWWNLQSQQRQQALARIDQQMSRGLWDQAQSSLLRLKASGADPGELDYRLGVCQAALNQPEKAVETLGRVPDDAPSAPDAKLTRAQLAFELGRYALAESLLPSLADQPGELGQEANRLLRQILLYTGRTDALVHRLETRWRLADDPSGQLLRTHWLLKAQAFPVQAVRQALHQAHRQAPRDDRVWLGLANLASRSGDLDTAEHWLSRCLERRPDDPAVWKAQLLWALAAGQLDSVLQALPHLPASAFSSDEQLRLRAQIAALQGDQAAESKALDALLDQAPSDTWALERAADLATKSHDRDRLAQLRRRKGEIDRLTDQYRTLMGDDRTPSDSRKQAESLEALARSAEALGLRFEARGWWSLAANRPGRFSETALNALRRLDPQPSPSQSEKPRKTLAELLADLVPSSPEPGSSTVTATADPSRGPVPSFSDDARSAGLAFVYDSDPTPLQRLPETMGGGVGLIDYDQDGWLDVYAVQGGPFPPGESTPNGGDRLFRNLGDGTFEDVSGKTGIAAMPRGYGHGVSVADYDNDGWPDLFITRWRSYALYRNLGDGTFQDVTESVGLAGSRDWPTSSAFADLDNDGDLDLYVCHYLKWDPETSKPCPHPSDPNRNTYCVPRPFEAEPDHLFRNDNGHFIDVTDQAGIIDLDGRGLGVLAADLDLDGALDLYVANDMTANFFFRNLGNLTFEEQGLLSGVGANAQGGYQAGMGVACGDLNADGLPDLAVTNFYAESTTFYRNLGGGLFSDLSDAIGLTGQTRFLLGFGIAFLDANNDGWLDLATANGHVNDLRPATPYAMPAQLLLGDSLGHLTDVSSQAGTPWLVNRVGRGLASGDLDNDNRVDLLILSQNQPLAFFHNTSTHSGHALTLALQGTRSNRDAVGARVILSSNGRRQYAQKIGGGSFLSASDPRLHFGLADAQSVDLLEIHWPSGAVDRIHNLPADSAYLIVEGQSQPRPLTGWDHP